MCLNFMFQGANSFSTFTLKLNYTLFDSESCVFQLIYCRGFQNGGPGSPKGPQGCAVISRNLERKGKTTLQNVN